MPHRAQLGFIAPEKAGAGTPELVHVPSLPGASWRKTATAAAATTQAAATAAGARELASASALPPLINTAGRRGCTGRGRAAGASRSASSEARSLGDVGLREGGSGEVLRGSGCAPR